MFSVNRRVIFQSSWKNNERYLRWLARRSLLATEALAM